MAKLMFDPLSCTVATISDAGMPHSFAASAKRILIFSPVCRSGVWSIADFKSRFLFIQCEHCNTCMQYFARKSTCRSWRIHTMHPQHASSCSQRPLPTFVWSMQRMLIDSIFYNLVPKSLSDHETLFLHNTYRTAILRYERCNPLVKFNLWSICELRPHYQHLYDEYRWDDFR